MNISRKLELAYEKIKSANKILLVTHPQPDGDAVSSTGAMLLLLEKMGKNYFAFCKNEAPKELLFLPMSESIKSDKEKFDFGNFDLIIALDCGSLARTFLADEIRTRKKNQFVIEFDHHPRIDDYANLEIRISNASSTAEIVYYFYKHNKLKINKDVANCVLTGIITDTGNFLYPSTTDRTVRIASEMLIYGAKYPRIIEETWRNKSIGAMKLWGRAMANLEINKKYNIAFTVLTKSDIEECECSLEELEGISGFLSNLHGVRGLMMLREDNDGNIKGSLRTGQGNLNVSKLAKKLGGGGHEKASGFVMPAVLHRVGNHWKLI